MAVTSNRIDRLAEQIAAGKGAAAPADDPPDGDFGLRIARDGTWYHDGTAIRRPALVKLFSTVLRRDEHGEFWLVTPVEKGRIVVEDAPFVAVALETAGTGREQRLSFRTNVDQIVTAGPDHPIRVDIDRATGEPAPYVRVRENLDALLLRPVFYQLVELAEETEIDGRAALRVWSEGVSFPIGYLDGRP